ncbi:MAG: PhoU domain-containing protein [Gammaproteobacteria bacterium]|nr:PhoU domain-containing protein [Gammaproteobacteria bacterium]
MVQTITDLERIGDEASRIARMAMELAGMERDRDPAPELNAMSSGVREMLRAALDAFARVDLAAALDVIARDKEIDRHYDALVERLVPAMEERPDQIRSMLNLIWCARSLERIGDHAKNVSEYVVYLGKGQDVRHQPKTAPQAATGRRPNSHPQSRSGDRRPASASRRSPAPPPR